MAADDRTDLRDHQSGLGFRQFRLWDLEKASLEWALLCLAHNIRRVHVLGAGPKLRVVS